MLELIVEFLGELLLQAFGELLVELGLHTLAEPFRRAPNPWFAALAYAIFGAALGGLSLLVLLHNLVRPPWRLLNLILTLLLLGGLMALIGSWRARRGQAVLRIDQFAFGYLFALAFAVVRFRFAG